MALNHGLGTSVLIGQRSAEDAMAVLRYHVDRLFTPTDAEATSTPPTSATGESS